MYGGHTGLKLAGSADLGYNCFGTNPGWEDIYDWLDSYDAAIFSDQRTIEGYHPFFPIGRFL
jgi:hypothetical protein